MAGACTESLPTVTSEPPITDTSIPLHEGWQLAEVPHGAQPADIARLPAEAWLPARVPGSAHGALLAAGRIPDPFLGLNELAVRWVGERSWAWRLAFEGGEVAEQDDLVFDGLDTWCTAWLNGEPLLTSDNMFVPQRVDVRTRLRPGRNELLLRFDPALASARAAEAPHGRRALWNGDSARLYARKAQYHFGWDWGPELLTCGPWRAVRRQRCSVRIDELAVHTRLDPAADTARIDVQARWVGPSAGLRLRCSLHSPEGELVARLEQPADAGAATLELSQPRLWWPRGMGAQPLYRLSVALMRGDTVLTRQALRIGLRDIALVQAPVQGEPGSSFHFEVNGRAFFAGGANWIPDDSLLERVTPERYRARVQQAADANMTMLRVWGGGIYEDDSFYDACDELGLLVWQDFAFACGMYPAHAAFQASVRAEATAALRRLRHHACLALWCGNNEDYAVAESIGAYGPQAPADGFAARALYERLLPDLVAELDPGRPYWPGSPYSPNPQGVTLSSDPTVGDRHSWEVWHQQMLPYQRYGEVQGRFVSEFGLQSHPSLALLEAVLPEAERYPESRMLAWHNKAGSGQPDGHRRLAVYLADNLRAGSTLAEQVYATQFVQAEAMRVAYQDFRRRWQRPGARACGGALVWQLNDCWPATSWALIDSAGVVKPAWHAIRRALAPLAVALRLAPGTACAAVMNGNASAAALTLILRVITLDGRVLHEQSHPVEVAADTSCEFEWAVPPTDEPVVGELRALQAGGGAAAGLAPASEYAPECARDCAWPEPFRFHRFAPAGLQVRPTDGGLQLSVQRPLKGLWLQAEATRFADNFIDLLPGAPRFVAVQGPLPAVLRATALDHPAQEITLTR